MRRFLLLLSAAALTLVGCANHHAASHRAPASWPKPPPHDHWDDLPPVLPPLPDPKPSSPPAEPTLEIVPLTSFLTLAAACEALRAHAREFEDPTPEERFFFRVAKKGCTQRATKNPIRNGFLVEFSRVTSSARGGVLESIVVAPGFQRDNKFLVALDAEVVSSGVSGMRVGFANGTIEVRESFLVDLTPDVPRAIVFLLTVAARDVGPTSFIVCHERGAWCTKPVAIDEGSWEGERQPLKSTSFKFEPDPIGLRVIDPTRTRRFRLPEKLTPVPTPAETQ